jgi:hypothetical protein
MVLPVARTRYEAETYVMVNPCVCGQRDFRPEHIVDVPAGPHGASEWHGVCPGCGHSRLFVFGRPARPYAEPQPGERGPEWLFGGSEPSELIDPGCWMAIALDYVDAARRTPRIEGSVPLFRPVVHELWWWAAAAVAEAAKFVPGSADEVPVDAFMSGVALRTHASAPAGAFRRRALRHRVAGYLKGRAVGDEPAWRRRLAETPETLGLPGPAWVRLLAALLERFARFEASSDPALLLDHEALLEASALTGPNTLVDPITLQTCGMLHWQRHVCQALAGQPAADDLAAALRCFRPLLDMERAAPAGTGAPPAQIPRPLRLVLECRAG